MSQFFFIGIALVLIFEGILPFLSPRIWRRVMLVMLTQTDRSLRIIGLISMTLGVGLLYLVH